MSLKIFIRFAFFIATNGIPETMTSTDLFFCSAFRMSSVCMRSDGYFVFRMCDRSVSISTHVRFFCFRIFLRILFVIAPVPDPSSRTIVFFGMNEAMISAVARLVGAIAPIVFGSAKNFCKKASA